MVREVDLDEGALLLLNLAIEEKEKDNEQGFLPSNVLYRVFAYLEDKKDLLNVGLVCTAWKRASDNHDFWRLACEKRNLKLNKGNLTSFRSHFFANVQTHCACGMSLNGSVSQCKTCLAVSQVEPSQDSRKRKMEVLSEADEHTKRVRSVLTSINPNYKTVPFASAEPLQQLQQLLHQEMKPLSTAQKQALFHSSQQQLFSIMQLLSKKEQPAVAKQSFLPVLPPLNAVAFAEVLKKTFTQPIDPSVLHQQLCSGRFSSDLAMTFSPVTVNSRLALSNDISGSLPSHSPTTPSSPTLPSITAIPTPLPPSSSTLPLSVTFSAFNNNSSLPFLNKSPVSSFTSCAVSSASSLSSLSCSTANVAEV
eukprot:TRINITY_DN7387_c0_g1_i1.p1 TRINITY_DN7387_c0_g1~~TRINITY_DN7387_c0_g1_i1.p1  ORF type:complete len:364 (-),score=79.35 TRINITY_DN7387_c0_g1_i1:77-1168(-)